MTSSEINTTPTPPSLDALEKEAVEGIRRRARVMRQIASVAIQPAMNTIGAVHTEQDAVIANDQELAILSETDVEKERRETTEALFAFTDLLPQAVYQKPPDSDPRLDSIKFKDTDLVSLRMTEATVVWVRLRSRYLSLSEQRVGNATPMFIVGEKLTEISEGAVDAKAQLLLVPAVLTDPTLTLPSEKNSIFMATVSSVEQERIDEMSVRALATPPSSTDIKQRYRQLRYEDGQVRYTLACQPLRTISDPLIGGAKLKRVPSDETKRARFYQDLDQKLRQTGMKSDSIKVLDGLTPAQFAEYEVGRHTAELAALYGHEDAHADMLAKVA